MDPLSDILSLLRPRSTISACLDAGGDWSVRFPDQEDGIKCGAVSSGACWLAVDGETVPVRLEAGDCFLLPTGRPFRLASDLRLPSQDASLIFSSARDGVATCNGGGAAFLVSSRFTLAGRQAALLLDLLPPVVHVQDGQGHSALRWSIERMAEELRDQRPGSLLVAEHLAHMVLIQALRRHLDEGVRGGVGWLFALADRRVSAAMAAFHADPARRWTLQLLAECAGMSRSIFALRFREAVGEPPMDYLARWRMTLAADRLTKPGVSVSTVAWSVGYRSEAAFSTAFKRVMGHSPRRQVKGQNTTELHQPPAGRRVDVLDFAEHAAVEHFVQPAQAYEPR
ncbi:AraC family transcriptional regulator [Pararhizobium sp. PWRC1-1]|uniref:AraC family transcriptional regulator n=1 Tax=Pararhizobium sp. PWRC1-1 TaxID=2804566 RepID=UPI003CF67573